MNYTPKVRQKTFGVQFINLNYDTASFFKDSPIYDSINYLPLLRCCATEIDSCCLYALVSHQVSKESNIVESFKEVHCETMTGIMRINDLFGVFHTSRHIA